MTREGRTSRCLAPALTALMVFGPSTVGASTPSEDKAIRQTLERAKVAYNLRDYAEASVQWQSAYRAARLPVLLFNIGQAERLQKHYEEAYDYYDAYLREQTHRDSHPPRNVDEATAYRDRMKAMMDECKEHPRRRDCKRPKAAAESGPHDAH